jgi:hypothetical protein
MLLGVVSANALRKMRASGAPEGLRAPRNDELIPCHVVCVERRNGATRCFLEATHVTPAMARRCLLQCAKDAVERCAIERAELPPSPITAMVLGDLRLIVHIANRMRRPLPGQTLWGICPHAHYQHAHFIAPSTLDISPVLAHALPPSPASLRFELGPESADALRWTTGEGVCAAGPFAFYRMHCI